jgi:hypothetical protein
MCDAFGLHDRVTMQALYNDRRMWIAAYIKEDFLRDNLVNTKK